MTAPRFSIVIPTRERPHTLEHTLATCLAQAGDFEVVVSDNGSGPRTRELVEACADPRVRYVRTPALLAMTDSLEFAVSHARGEYVIVQGDDDGLLRHALAAVDAALTATGAAVLQWDSAVYNWPDVSNPYFSPDTLLLPLLHRPVGHLLRPRAARQVIAEVAAGRVPYSELPVIYNAVIKRDLFDRLRARTGRVFKTRTPDVHAAFAVAALVDTFHALRAPIGVCGRSGASTGVARHFSKKGSPIDNEFRRLNEAAGLSLHPWVPDLPPIPSAVADAFLWAKADLFPDDAGTNLDRAQLVRDCIAETELDSAAEWNEVRAACRAALADAPELLAWFEREYGAREWSELPRPDRGRHRSWRRYGPGHLFLDTAALGACNVDDVADLCERLLGYARDGVNLHIETSAGDAERSELQEKESQVRYLTRECAELQEQLRRQHTAFTLHIEGQDERLRVQEERLKRQDEVLAGQRLRIVGLEKQAQKGVIGRIADLIRPRRAG
ncbi:glycosyltransferase [Gemmata sp. JC673]|uniref:Glycosyltransferase n=1 Tax=Gemmata algarum TaxID=2975278 RepID=A0ABU5F793_9BACT|nr:glycosyltransferase [Gemmata algarum]MDY3563407.1 glycosyltransferase [Gemmata algarum]